MCTTIFYDCSTLLATPFSYDSNDNSLDELVISIHYTTTILQTTVILEMCRKYICEKINTANVAARASSSDGY